MIIPSFLDVKAGEPDIMKSVIKLSGDCSGEISEPEYLFRAHLFNFTHTEPF